MLPVEVWGDRCKPEFADAFTYVLYVWHEAPHFMENDHGASGGRRLDEERGHSPTGALKAQMTLLQLSRSSKVGMFKSERRRCVGSLS